VDDGEDEPDITSLEIGKGLCPKRAAWLPVSRAPSLPTQIPYDIVLYCRAG
jgi:hypothetical protein